MHNDRLIAKPVRSEAKTNRGFSISNSTLDLDRTRAFYQDVLGFKPVVADTLRINEGGRLRHLFFDIGRDQLLAFMEARDVQGVPADYDAGINRGLAFRTPLPFRLRGRVGEIAGRQAQRNCGRKAWRSPTSWIMVAPSRSTSGDPTGSRWSTAA